jgi:hypothetical protein
MRRYSVIAGELRCICPAIWALLRRRRQASRGRARAGGDQNGITARAFSRALIARRPDHAGHTLGVDLAALLLGAQQRVGLRQQAGQPRRRDWANGRGVALAQMDTHRAPGAADAVAPGREREVQLEDARLPSVRSISTA